MKLPTRKQLVMLLAFPVCAVSFAVTSYAGEAPNYRGCWTAKLCTINGQQGICGWRDDGGNGACACFEVQGEQNWLDTCECSTGQYPPCGGG